MQDERKLKDPEDFNPAFKPDISKSFKSLR